MNERPLGITARWPLDPEGLAYGFGHLRLRARDLVALGTLYLDHGVYGGHRILSEAYIADATAAHGQWCARGDAYGFLWLGRARPRRVLRRRLRRSITRRHAEMRTHHRHDRGRAATRARLATRMRSRHRGCAAALLRPLSCRQARPSRHL
jgi:CubicO group peptidase (beta-lactamase class C family)